MLRNTVRHPCANPNPAKLQTNTHSRYPAPMRVFLAMSLVILISACSSYVSREAPWTDRFRPNGPAIYGALPDEPYPVPAVNLAVIEPRYYRRLVDYRSEHPAGTVVVDTRSRYLYLVMPYGQAMRYGIGIGRAGFTWNGTARIADKRPWPTWTPPKEMIAREPRLQEFANGMPPGLDNPLGARALYIYRNGKDTLYRLHGTSEANSIGRAVSSGCIRLLNHDVIDLYNRVQPSAKIVVLNHDVIDLKLSQRYFRQIGVAINRSIADIRREF